MTMKFLLTVVRCKISEIITFFLEIAPSARFLRKACVEVTQCGIINCYNVTESPSKGWKPRFGKSFKMENLAKYRFFGRYP